jgi:hypothetical protein
MNGLGVCPTPMREGRKEGMQIVEFVTCVTIFLKRPLAMIVLSGYFLTLFFWFSY